MTFFPDSSTFLQIGTLEIKWYAILILIGAFAAYYLMSQQFKKMGYEQDDADNIFIGCLLFGVIGARIWYVLFSDLQSYLADPITIIEVWNGGLAIHGGLIAGIIFAYLYAKKHKLSFFRIADGVLPYVLIAQAIGRWGNFINKEAFGKPVTEAYFEHWPSFLNFIKEGMFINGSYQEPMFLYESVLCVIGFILIILYRKYSHPKRGDLTYCYLLWYGAIRFWIEADRSDSLMIFGLKMAQIISIIFMVIGLLGLLGVWRKLKKPVKPILLFDNDETLIDSEKAIQESFKKTLKEYLPDRELTQDELDGFLGPTLEESFSKYLPQDKVNEASEKYRAYNEELLKEVKPMPGAKEALEKWKGEGYKLGVVSSKKKETVVKGLGYVGMDTLFDVIIGLEDCKHPKPAKDGIINACKALGLSHDEVIYVGDSVTDIQAAKKAGVYSVGYSDQEKRNKELKAAQPNATIAKLSELDEILKGTNSWTANLR